MISGGSLPASPKNQTQWQREDIASGISKKPGIAAASRDRFRHHRKIRLSGGVKRSLPASAKNQALWQRQEIASGFLPHAIYLRPVGKKKRGWLLRAAPV